MILFAQNTQIWAFWRGVWKTKAYRKFQISPVLKFWHLLHLFGWFWVVAASCSSFWPVSGFGMLKAHQLENFLPVNIPNKLENTSSPPEVFLRTGVPKICSKFTGEHPCRSVISIELLALLLYWNYTSPWVSSCKFDAYFQNTFVEEHLSRAACGNIYL